MQTSTEYLKQILHVVSSIDQSMKGEKSSVSSSGSKTGEGKGPSIFKGVGMHLKQMFSVNYKGSKNFISFTQELLKLSEKTPDKNVQKLKLITDSFNGLSIYLPKLSKGLEEFGNIREKKVDRVISHLIRLYEFLDNAGDGRKAKKIERSINTFEKLGEALQKVAKPIKTMSMALINISLGILAFAGAIVLSGKILGLGKGADVFRFVIVAILGIALVFGILAVGKKVIDRGTDAIGGIGKGLTWLSVGIVSFALTIAIVPRILGTGGDVLSGVLAVAGIVVLAGLLFAGLGLLSKFIMKGVMVTAGMGIGMMFLAAGVLVFALAAKAMGAFADKDATRTTKDGETKKRGKFGQIFAGIGPGLGMMGIIIIGAAILFSGLGLLSKVIAPGILVAIGMAIAMIMLTKAVKRMVETAATLGTKEEIKESVGKTIGGVLGGFLDGIMVLAEGKKGMQGLKAFLKNSAVIFAGTGVLLSMSLALSQFAKALTAFSEFENMRVIDGYDDEGRPKFGEKINIRDVSDNITYSISTFLSSIITATEGLTRSKAGAIRKMARALTGKRGILTAVIQFSEVLKTYAKFGPEGKIGFIDMVPDGTDEDGNAKFKQVASSVLITDVVQNIISSFGTFVEKLTAHTDEFTLSGKHGRRMGHLAEALLGKKGRGGREKYGILQPVEQFAETLTIYAKFGANNEIPIIDPETGKVIDRVSVSTIAKNIINSLTAFTEELGKEKINADTKKAEKNLKIFDDIIKKTNKISTSIDGLDRLSKTLGELATSIGLLSANLATMDMDKLNSVSRIGSTYLYKTNDFSIANERISQGSSPNEVQTPISAPIEYESRRAGTTTTASVKEPNWDLIAAQIGESVGSQLVSAMKSNQIKFQFSGAGSNSGVVEFG